MTFTMTVEQVTAVQDSWMKNILPLGKRAAHMVLQELFRREPSLRARFLNLPKQEADLMTTLTLVIRGLTNPTSLVPFLHKLGSIPAHRAVKPSEYTLLGEAFLSTLERGFGNAFTPDLRSAWTAFYEWVAATMQEDIAAS